MEVEVLETILSWLTVVMGTFASCMITRLATSFEGAHAQRPLSPSAPVGCNGDAQGLSFEGGTLRSRSEAESTQRKVW